MPSELGRLRRVRMATTTSAAAGSLVLLSSGYLAWQAYGGKSASAAASKPVARPYKAAEHKGGPEYIVLPADMAERFKTLAAIDAKEELKSLIPKHLRRPWKLLRAANWGEYEEHLNAVRELGKLNLNDGEYRQIAQSCNRCTAVGLARTPEVDLRLFLPPPPCPERFAQTSTPKLFERILSALPSDSPYVHDCIRTLTSTALDSYVPGCDDEALADADLGNEFNRDSDVVMFPVALRRRYTERNLVDFCLQALLGHSTVGAHCIKMIEQGVLPVFAKILRDHPNNPAIKSLIGKILANISLHEETHEAVFRSGWVGILAAWKQDPNLLVTLPATKALCNLDQKYGDVYMPGVYLLLPEHRSVRHLNEISNWGVDVVFIHGMLGGVFYSWRQLDSDNSRGWGTPDLVSTPDYSYCWPRDWMSELSADNNVRVIGVDFDSYLSQWGNTCPSESFRTNLADRSADILEKLKASGVGKRPTIFVGHSLGGLIIKKMLVSAANSSAASDADRELVANARGVLFYGTPHAGTAMANLGSAAKYLFFPTAEVRELETGSPQLEELNSSFKELVSQSQKSSAVGGMEVVSFGESKATPYLGLDLTFVPPESSNPGVGVHTQVDSNHMNICKPGDRQSVLYKKLGRMVLHALYEATPFEVN